jgi:hypothetical protein
VPRERRPWRGHAVQMEELRSVETLSGATFCDHSTGTTKEGNSDGPEELRDIGE